MYDASKSSGRHGANVLNTQACEQLVVIDSARPEQLYRMRLTPMPETTPEEVVWSFT
jgi:hypothetical protein